MSTERFRRFEADGSSQQMMPLLITDQILVKPVSNGSVSERDSGKGTSLPSGSTFATTRCSWGWEP